MVIEEPNKCYEEIVLVVDKIAKKQVKHQHVKG